MNACLPVSAVPWVLSWLPPWLLMAMIIVLIMAGLTLTVFVTVVFVWSGSKAARHQRKRKSPQA